MTEIQRYTAINQLIERYTDENTVSQKVARDALIREGIYTKSGKLKKRFDERLPAN